jgi:hypothetical protein
MASFTFTLPGSTKTFSIKGPDGFSEAQARAIFDQQAAAGSFVGFKPGDALNAAKQAAAGLPGAAAQLAQSLSGTTSIINGAVLNNAVGQATGQLSQAVGQAAGQISQAVGQATSVAKQAIGTVTDIISKVPVTNGINPADFAKQASALVPIGNLTSVDVRAGLAQASKLVGQAADTVSNTLGVGKFGFDGAQLESAGILKPGVAAQYLQSGVNKLTDVLKSPTVFTGKAGIKSLTDLLDSVPKQNNIQQGLMAKGLEGLKQVGIPTDSLNPTALVGTVLNAAKSLPAAADWAKGLPVPPGVKTAFDQVARDGAFAVDLANQNITNSLKKEIVPVPASDTVNRETVNAAASRVVGNAKVPAVSYSDAPKVDIAKFIKAVDATLDRALALGKQARQIINSTSDSQPSQVRQLEQVVGDYSAVNGAFLSLLRDANLIKAQLGATPPQLSTIESSIEATAKIVKALETRIEDLKKKIENSAA